MRLGNIGDLMKNNLLTILASTTILALASCGGNGDSEAKVTQPSGLDTTALGAIFDYSGTDVVVTPEDLSGIRAVDENNGVYALTATPVNYNGSTIYMNGAYYDGKAYYIGIDTSLNYQVFGAQGDGMVSNPATSPLTVDTRYVGIYSDVDVRNGDQETGDAIIDVNGANNYLTVSGPDILSGKKHNWNSVDKSYQYNSNSLFSFGLVNSEAASVNYTSLNSQGVVYGVR